MKGQKGQKGQICCFSVECTVENDEMIPLIYVGAAELTCKSAIRIIGLTIKPHSLSYNTIVT